MECGGLEYLIIAGSDGTIDETTLLPIGTCIDGSPFSRNRSSHHFVTDTLLLFVVDLHWILLLSVVALVVVLNGCSLFLLIQAR